ncbi:hypothetical protein HK097_001892 [Rhizophlyctis rosea]|uniref:Uncharacterized protein n=1 Tax=Rhizophlyctis rosea TaxID=64517 RepID=A0AAD5WY36_9FUNG|nr:hypothetical protein HK097_001892 [Rhizophlyctis rosea]
MASPMFQTLPNLPLETITHILQYLPTILAYRIGVLLKVAYNYPNVRNDLLPLIPGASMNRASMKGQVELLDWWLERKQHGYPIHYTSAAMDRASGKGHLRVLIWWQDSGLPLKYSHEAMNWATRNGHLHCLGFWVDSGLRMRWTRHAMDNASQTGNVASLEWWKQSGLECRYSEKAMDSAANVEVLQWWKESGLYLRFTEKAMDLAASVEMLQWWKDSGMKLYYAQTAIHNAIRSGRIDLLEWWRTRGLELRYDQLFVMTLANNNGMPDILQWWLHSGLQFRVPAIALDFAANAATLEWWKRSGLLLEWTERALLSATLAGDRGRLKWWRNGDLKMKIPSFWTLARHLDSPYGCGDMTPVEVLEFWKETLDFCNAHYPVERKVNFLDEWDRNAAPSTSAAALFEQGSIVAMSDPTFPPPPIPPVQFPHWTQDPDLHLPGPSRLTHCPTYTPLRPPLPKTPHFPVLHLPESKSLPTLPLALPHLRKHALPSTALAAQNPNNQLPTPSVLHPYPFHLYYSASAMNHASARGEVSVLNWWLKSGAPLKYTADAMDFASCNGHADMLEWWASSGLELKYTPTAYGMAKNAGHVKCVEWWEKSGLDFEINVSVEDWLMGIY